MKIEETLREVFKRLNRLEAATGSGWGNVRLAEVLPSQSRTDGTYGDLTTVGPEVWVDIRGTGRLLVFFTATIASFGQAAVSFGLTNANILAADDTRSSFLEAGVSRVGAFEMVEGLNPGLTLVTMKYRGDDIDAGQFYNRKILAVSI